MVTLKRENNARRSQAMTFSCLGKLRGVSVRDFNRWKRVLTGLLDRSVRGIPKNLLVIGLAESGIIPSALFHQVLAERCRTAGWICSTRRPARGLYFSESHSHAPHHVLPIPSEKPAEIWFVEDELTTGRTLVQVALKACRNTGVRRVRFFAFADTRAAHHRKWFDRMLHLHGIRASLHALKKTSEFENAAEPTDHPAEAELHDACGGPDGNPPDETAPMLQTDHHWHWPDRRPGLSIQRSPEMALPVGLEGSLLAVGEAIDLGIHVVQANPAMHLHHITLSPWEVDGSHIRTRLRIGENYYLYNHHRLKPPVYLLNDPIDNHVARCAARLLGGLDMPVRPLGWPSGSRHDL